MGSHPVIPAKAGIQGGRVAGMGSPSLLTLFAGRWYHVMSFTDTQSH